MIRLALVLIALEVFLAGCSVRYKAVGRFDDFNEVFVGDVDANLLTGGARISVETKNTEMKCDGSAYPPDNIPSLVTCAGQSGRGAMQCSDGRQLDIEWTATSCTTGYGRGTDQNGVTFRFAFGFSDEKAQQELARVSDQVASSPSLPVYRPRDHRQQKGFSTGTGFFVTNDGVMVTNYHVIEGASRVVVVNPAQQTEWEATVLRVDPANDLAIIKVAAATTPAPLAAYFGAAKGEEVFALGYPLIALQGQEQKATFGRVNALSGIQGDIRLVQVDVPVQPGNSGGPLLNRRGEVIGIVTSTLDQVVTLRASGALPQNVNFAVKVDYLFPVLRAALGDGGPSVVPSDRALLDFPELVSLSEPSVLLVVAK